MRVSRGFFKKVTKVTSKSWSKILKTPLVRPSNTRGQEAQNFRVSLGFEVWCLRAWPHPEFEGEMSGLTSVPAWR